MTRDIGREKTAEDLSSGTITSSQHYSTLLNDIDLLPRDRRQDEDASLDLLVPRHSGVDVLEHLALEALQRTGIFYGGADVCHGEFGRAMLVINATDSCIVDERVGNKDGLEFGGCDLLAVGS